MIHPQSTLAAILLVPALAAATPPGPTVLGEGQVPAATMARYASLEGSTRGQYSHALGEKVIDDWAKKNGWTKLYGETRPGQQGIDRIYRTSEGRLVCVEAKGPGGKFTTVNGHRQGTPGYNVNRLANHLMKHDSKLARELLDAFRAGKADSCVSVVAKSGKWTLVVHPLSRDTARQAGALLGRTGATAASTTLRSAGKAAPLVGLAVEGYHRASRARDIERDYHRGALDDRERVHGHARNVAGSAGGLGGAAAGATYLGSTGAAVGTSLGPIGTGVGGFVGGVAGGALGYVGGEKAAETVVDAGKGAIYYGVVATGRTVRAAHRTATRTWRWIWGY